MTGTLLRTGNLKEFHPLGAVGNPVYLSASQLQSALRRRLGAPVANILAIPQRNEDGDIIDWYAPLPGPVVPWSAATPQERTQAKAELLGIRERIRETGEQMRGDENSERQIFGQLLDLVTTFPNDGHVYLVDGHPVITFWGFQEMDAPANSDPLLTLPEADESPAPPPPPITETPAPPADQPETPTGRRFPWWWLLALLMLILLLLLALKMCGQEKVEEPAPVSPPTEEPAKQPSPEEKPPAPEEEKPPIDESVEPKFELEPRQVIDRVRDVDVVRDQVVVDKVIDGETTGAIDTDQVVADTVTDGVATEGVAEALEGAPGEEPSVDADIPTSETMDAVETPTDEAPDESLQDGREQVPPEETAAPENDQEAPEKEPQGDPPGKAPQEAPETDLEKDSESGLRGDAEKDNPKLGKDAQAPAITPDQPGSADGEKPQGPLLQIPKEALQSGSTEFLDGRWSSSTSLMDSQTGRPIELEYAFQGGEGTVSLKRDGVVCEGKTGAAIKDGKLVISDTGNITCPDGTRYRGARVECRIDEQGRADCSGGYPSGDSFSTKIRKSEPTPAE